jgi:hypothetical protein
MNPTYKALAEEFARNLAQTRFEHAHELLVPVTQATTPPEKLAADYATMIGYGEGEPPTLVEALQYAEDWPAKESGDLAWIYVAIAAESYSEAVTLVVAAEDARLGVRTAEWGRP